MFAQSLSTSKENCIDKKYNVNQLCVAFFHSLDALSSKSNNAQ